MFISIKNFDLILKYFWKFKFFTQTPLPTTSLITHSPNRKHLKVFRSEDNPSSFVPLVELVIAGVHDTHPADDATIRCLTSFRLQFGVWNFRVAVQAERNVQQNKLANLAQPPWATLTLAIFESIFVVPAHSSADLISFQR